VRGNHRVHRSNGSSLSFQVESNLGELAGCKIIPRVRMDAAQELSGCQTLVGRRFAVRSKTEFSASNSRYATCQAFCAKKGIQT
jgi:hypothetical protein